MVHSACIPLSLPLSLSLFLCSHTRAHSERTMESQVSFYSRKRYRLRAFTVQTRKIDREEVVGEHKTHLPSFFINVFTTISRILRTSTELSFPRNRSIANSKRFNRLSEGSNRTEESRCSFLFQRSGRRAASPSSKLYL